MKDNIILTVSYKSKEIGSIWVDSINPLGYECESSITGNSYGSIDSLEDAIQVLVDEM